MSFGTGSAKHLSKMRSALTIKQSRGSGSFGTSDQAKLTAQSTSPTYLTD